MRLLFYDSISTGHHSEYISHLVNYIINENLLGQYYFVVSIEFESRFTEIIQKSKESTTIHWEFIPLSKVNEIHNLALFKRSFSELALVDYYAKKLSFENVYLLHFNVFQFALIFKKPKFNISGILFLQFFRMNRVTFNEKIKYFRKYFITKFYSKNKSIKTIFILNDYRSVDFLNNRFKTTIFKMLPDPIPEIEPLVDFDIYEHYKIENNRKIFLHIGSLSDRKGTFEIIDSAKFIPTEKQLNFTILLVGKAKDSTTGEIILNKIKENSFKSNVQIIWDNQFVSNPQMKSLFNQCDSVLIPYKNTEASSGILGHAVAASKPVISSEHGLLGELIKNNNFGILLDAITAKNIGKSITYSFNTEIKYNNSEFILNHTVENFSNTLINK